MFNIFLTFIYLSFFFSTINGESFFLAVTAAFVGSMLGFLHLQKQNIQVNFPRLFPLAASFVLVLHLYLLFTFNWLEPIKYTMVFSVGLLYWVIFYNLKDSASILENLTKNFVLLYGSIFLLTKLLNFDFTRYSSIMFHLGQPKHYFFALLCSMAIVVLAKDLTKNKTPKDWIVLLLSLFFMAISNNRSAILALVGGLIFLFSKNNYFQKNKKIIYKLILPFAIVGFVVFSLNKTVIFDRPYYLHSIKSFTHFPFGVGMGNFNLVNEYILKTTTENSVAISDKTHNLFLETLSGVGVFSLLFLVFLVKQITDLFKTNQDGRLWASVVLSMLICFMFDTSYSIPFYIWLFFSSLGVFNQKSLS